MATTTVTGAEAADADGADVAASGTDLVSAVRTAWLMIVLGTIGLIASGLLLIERIAVATDPDYVPSCSINPLVSSTRP